MSREITIWIDERWYNALSKHLKDETLEEHLEGVIDEMCNRLPEHEYQQISTLIWQERQQAERDREAARCFAAFHITEHGEERWLRQDENTEFLQAAILLRKYLTDEHRDSASSFADTLRNTQPVSESEFHRMVMERAENTGRVSGAFQIDLDAGVFTALHTMDGWKSYNVRDVSTAAYRATQKSYASTDERWSTFLDRLDGRELTDAPRPIEARGSRRLMDADVAFADEIMEIGGRLNFCLANVFDVDEVFGTHVETDENGNWLSVYIDYDLESGNIADELGLTLYREDVVDVQMAYRLDDEEKVMLLKKMDAFCQLDSGRSLEEWREEYLVEQKAGDGPAPMMGQSM